MGYLSLLLSVLLTVSSPPAPEPLPRGRFRVDVPVVVGCSTGWVGEAVAPPQPYNGGRLRFVQSWRPGLGALRHEWHGPSGSVHVVPLGTDAAPCGVATLVSDAPPEVGDWTIDLVSDGAVLRTTAFAFDGDVVR